MPTTVQTLNRRGGMQMIREAQIESFHFRLPQCFLNATEGIFSAPAFSRSTSQIQILIDYSNQLPSAGLRRYRADVRIRHTAASYYCGTHWDIKIHFNCSWLLVGTVREIDPIASLDRWYRALSIGVNLPNVCMKTVRESGPTVVIAHHEEAT
ncbi:hypothetical protein A6456_29735 [Paraburkholderia tropica]|nr:hypothetical protein A6456_29735 [Paraburkholderia tropica]